VSGAGGSPAARGPDYPPPRVAWWSVAVFFLLYNLSFIDRAILNILIGPVRATLGISDFQISLLQGLAFAIFYTLCGLPIGWLVDHRARRWIIFVGVIVWSLAASVCGLASRYGQFLLGRIGLAAGEATLAPAAYSLLSDSFPADRLALPMSIMGTGASLGGALASVIAGLVVELVPPGGVSAPVVGHLVGWQVAMLAVAVPGLLLAPLIFTIPEAVRHHRSDVSTIRSRGEAVGHLRANPRLYGGHFIGFGIFSMCNYGVTSWLPSFFIRVHHWSLTQAALEIGALILLAGVPGGILMGLVVDSWYRRGRRNAHLIFFAIIAIVQLVSVAAAMTVSDPRLALVLLIPQAASASFTGVAAAALQIVTPARMRGQISAIYLMVFNLLGLGLGPSIVAFFTDYWFGNDQAVGQSILLTFAIFAPIAAACFLVAASPMRRIVAGRLDTA